MDEAQLRYSSLVVLKPLKNWEVDVMMFHLDKNVELLTQWISHDDDPILAVISKLDRLVGITPVSVSLDPVHSVVAAKIHKYYACTVPLFSRIPEKIEYYDGVSWERPRSSILNLKNNEDRQALRKAVLWSTSANFAPINITRNNLFMR